MSKLFAAAAPHADADASAASTQTVKRTLCVHVTGSLANLALAGPQAAMWKPMNGKESDVFYPSLDGELDPAEAMNAIRAGVVRNVVIKEHMSTYPVTLGVSVSCVPPTEVTDLGQKYAYTVLPHSRIASPQTIYACGESATPGGQWQSDYKEWNNENLETHKVMQTNGAPFVFVSQYHPVVGLLRFNADMIGCDIDKQPKLDNEYIRITRQVMNTCCQNLRAKVLNKQMTQDMNMFSLQLHRLNAQSWDDLNGVESLSGFTPKAKWTPEEHTEQKQHHLRQFVTTPYQYIARLEIEYELPSVQL